MRRLRERASAVFLAALLLAGCERDGARVQKRARLPIGNLDTPTTSTLELSGDSPLTLSGWAVSEDGIAEIDVFVDRGLVRSSGALLGRPDVGSAYPAIPGSARSGFQVVLDSREMGAGAHEVVLQVRTARGAVRELGRLTVVVPR